MYGRVLDATTGNPLPNATIDTWEASTNGEIDWLKVLEALLIMAFPLLRTL